MKTLKVFFAGIILSTTLFLLPTHVMGQWSLGATYELRDDTPQSGIGIRVEREILNPAPIVDIALRAHFSYFKEENDISSEGLAITRDIRTYDYGLAATAGVSVGILKPYVGAGIGSNTIEVETEDQSNSDTEFIWNGFFGVEVTPVPNINPFAEYRFQQTEANDFAGGFESEGRFIMGLIYSF